MRKQKSIRLSRETLRSLERPELGAVVGAFSTGCTKDPTACGNTICFSCFDTCLPTHHDC
jgi:hypothetical protein